MCSSIYICYHVLTQMKMFRGRFFFVLNFCWTKAHFEEPLPYGFQSQGGSFTCTLTYLPLVNLRVTSGATPTFSTIIRVFMVSACIQQAALLEIPHASSGGQATVDSETNLYVAMGSCLI